MRLFRKLLSISASVFLFASMFMAAPLVVNAEGAQPGGFTIVSSSIANNQVDVPRALKLTFEASDILDCYVDYIGKVTLKDDAGENTEVIASFSTGSKVFNIYVVGYLKPETNYTLTLPKGSIKDENGNTFAENYILKFKTRKDNVIKIGSHGDYKDFDGASFILNPDLRNTGDEVRVKVEQGNYYVPNLHLANSSVLVEGGYDSTFTNKGGKNLTVLKSGGNIFDIRIYDNWESGTKLKFGFNNLTFTKTDIPVEESTRVAYTAISFECESPYSIDMDITGCSFDGLSGTDYRAGDDGSLKNPVTIDAEGRCNLNLNISSSQFVDNEFDNRWTPCGGLMLYTGDGAVTNLRVVNSIFANNTGFISGAIATACGVNGKLNEQFYNNTIVRNKAVMSQGEYESYNLASSSGGIFIISQGLGPDIKADLKNNIILGNKVWLDGETSEPADVLLYSEKYSESEGTYIKCDLDSNDIGSISKNGDGVSTGNLPIEFTNKNGLSVDPMFTEQLHLSDSSPVIDKGVTVDLTTDFDGNKRPQGNGYDLGAFESVSSAQTASFSFEVASMEVNESSGKAVVTVKRTGSSTGEATVNYQTADGTAKAGTDYTSVSGTLTFNDGETSKTFDIAINNDAAVEQAEAFTAALSNPSEGAQLGEINNITINIKDDDTAQQPSGNTNTLPQTGTFVDTNVLVIL
ncbi:MAG: Calx-beta domain-containing protein, partial [Bacillota bacterium]|nr:Calx-beta domain-containing protein [Bacillota bacterium]